MIRCLIGFLCVCFIWLWGVDATAFAQVEKPQFTEQQLKKGDKIARKAIKALEKGDLNQSEAYWTKLIEEFPQNPAVWSNRGNVRVSQHRIKDAIADFDRSIAIAPQYPDAYLNRGIAYEGQKNWDLALADYNQVLEISPQDPVAYNNRGNAKAGQQKWQEALTDYEKAIEIAPSFSLARANAALVTYQIGDRFEATRQLRNLVRKYPMFPDVRAAMTAVLWVEGKQGEAESNWVAAVGLDNRYQSLDWVANIRRWPPKMVEALEQFLTLS
ncbi:tetratricopeptide repeat protein [Hyella patelloides]|nr:tetratricopeptide repeat protein [Hyella patelloides]